MSTSITSRLLLPAVDTRRLLIKWVVGLLVPVVVFTLWGGEAIINAVLAPGSTTSNVPTDPGSLIQAALFIAIFYAVVIVLTGYLVAADTDRGSMFAI